MIAASGGRTATASSASRTVIAGTTSKPASPRITRRARRICASSSQIRTRWRSLIGGRVAQPRRAAGWIANVDPWPGSDCARSEPPLASTKPRAIASPRPVPSWLAGGVEGLEDPLELLARDPGAAVGDPDRELGPIRWAVIVTGSSPA